MTNREPWRVSTKNGLDSLVEQAALFGSLSRGGRLDEIVDAESVFACVLEDGEALTVQVLLRDRDPQIGNGFHGLTMGCVTVHASELFGQNERLFLTESCGSPTPTSPFGMASPTYSNQVRHSTTKIGGPGFRLGWSRGFTPFGPGDRLSGGA